MSARMNTATPFEAFYNRQTPANAVALANADHRAGSVIDWEFVAALRKAEHVCNAHDELVAALRHILQATRHLRGSIEIENAQRAADSALAKVQS